MVDYAGVVKGVLAFFIGILVTIVTWYIAGIIDDVLVTLDISSTLRAIYWVGLLVTWISAVILVPYVTITKSMGRS